MPCRGDIHPETGLIYWDTFRGQQRWRNAATIARWRANMMRHVRRWQAKNPELNRASNRATKKKHAAQNAANFKRWKKNNPARWKALKNADHKKRLNDPVYRVKIRARGRIRAAIFSRGIDKDRRTFDLIGCTPAALKAHIEKQFKPGMSWARIREIHIDHKIPLSKAQNVKDLYRLCHFTNLQPLWAWENLAKGDKISA